MFENSIIMAICTAFFWGITPYFEKKAFENELVTPLITLYIGSIVSLLFLSFYIYFTNSYIEIEQASRETLLYFIFGGLLSGMCGYIIYLKALQLMEASMIVPLTSAYPLITLLLSVVFLSEPLTIIKSLGVILIVGGIILL